MLTNIFSLLDLIILKKIANIMMIMLAKGKYFLFNNLKIRLFFIINKN